MFLGVEQSLIAHATYPVKLPRNHLSLQATTNLQIYFLDVLYIDPCYP